MPMAPLERVEGGSRERGVYNKLASTHSPYVPVPPPSHDSTPLLRVTVVPPAGTQQVLQQPPGAYDRPAGGTTQAESAAPYQAKVL